MLVSTSLSRFISSRARPVPKTTHDRGSSAIETGRPVAWRKTKSILPKRAPPPVNTIPLSTISAASSGAVCSKATLTASMIAPTGSARLSPSFHQKPVQLEPNQNLMNSDPQQLDLY